MSKIVKATAAARPKCWARVPPPIKSDEQRRPDVGRLVALVAACPIPCGHSIRGAL